jgi:PAS domain S-box-containing protein
VHFLRAPDDGPRLIEKERYTAALIASRSGTWTWDIATDCVDWDEPLARMYGIGLDRAPRNAADFLILVHPDDRARVREAVETALRDKPVLEHEFRIVLPDGNLRWIYDRSRIARDSTGRPVSVVGCCIDITERKQSEQALRDGEARLELATRAADLGIWDWDLRTNTLVYSDRARAICGIPPDVPITVELLRAIEHPDDLSRTAAMATRALDPKLREREPFEYRIIRPDGAVRWVLAHGEAVFETVEGVEKAVRYVGTIQDITAKRQIEAALYDSESRLRLAIEAARIAVWEYDIPDDQVTLSPELKQLLGFAPDADPAIEELRTGYLPGERERLRQAGIDALARGENFFEVEYRYIRRDDQALRWFLLRAEILLGPHREPQRVIGILLDITDQKRAIDRQRLLVDELNHRVKNTLATVQSIATQSLRHSPDLTQAKASIEGRLFALSRAHDLLTEECWERAHIESVIERALPPELVDRERIQTHGPGIWLTARAALDLAMILQELLTNAMKYGALSTAQGRVRLTWHVETTPEFDLLHIDWSERGGPRVEKPARGGFGSRLIRTIASEQNGVETIVYEPEGLRCRLLFRLRREQPSVRAAE